MTSHVLKSSKPLLAQACLLLMGLALPMTSAEVRADEAPGHAPTAAARPPLKSGIALGVSHLSGQPGEPLAGAGRGAGLSFEAMARRGGNTFQYVGRVRFGLALGAATFTVDSSAQLLNYQLITGEAAAGLRINLMPQETTAIQPYFEVDGKYVLAALLVPSLRGSSQEIARTNTGRALGLDWIAGIEFHQRSFIELQLRGGAGTIGGIPSLQVGSAALAFGVLW
jgi:hypothetical protein